MVKIQESFSGSVVGIRRYDSYNQPVGRNICLEQQQQKTKLPKKRYGRSIDVGVWKTKQQIIELLHYIHLVQHPTQTNQIVRIYLFVYDLFVYDLYFIETLLYLNILL
jgi:hypothetical protein